MCPDSSTDTLTGLLREALSFINSMERPLAALDVLATDYQVQHTMPGIGRLRIRQSSLKAKLRAAIPRPHSSRGVASLEARPVTSCQDCPLLHQKWLYGVCRAVPGPYGSGRHLTTSERLASHSGSGSPSWCPARGGLLVKLEVSDG